MFKDYGEKHKDCVLYAFFLVFFLSLHGKSNSNKTYITNEIFL